MTPDQVPQRNIFLKLSVAEVDYVAQVLSQRPYAEVKNLVDKLVMQANDPELQSYGPPPQPPAPQPE